MRWGDGQQIVGKWESNGRYMRLSTVVCKKGGHRREGLFNEVATADEGEVQGQATLVQMHVYS